MKEQEYPFGFETFSPNRFNLAPVDMLTAP